MTHPWTWLLSGWYVSIAFGLWKGHADAIDRKCYAADLACWLLLWWLVLPIYAIANLVGVVIDNW